jgi:hypothetical protein
LCTFVPDYITTILRRYKESVNKQKISIVNIGEDNLILDERILFFLNRGMKNGSKIVSVYHDEPFSKSRTSTVKFQYFHNMELNLDGVVSLN